MFSAVSYLGVRFVCFLSVFDSPWGQNVLVKRVNILFQFFYLCVLVMFVIVWDKSCGLIEFPYLGHEV